MSHRRSHNRIPILPLVIAYHSFVIPAESMEESILRLTPPRTDISMKVLRSNSGGLAESMEESIRRNH